MATTKFKKGDKVDFTRNSTVNKKKAPIIAVVEMPTDLSGGALKSEQAYVIEYPDGWTPNAMRIEQFGLSANKTYLFVKESELV